MITPIEMIISLILTLIVGIVIGWSYRKKDELDKIKVKNDIKTWAKLMREANEKLIVVYKGLNEVYKEVSK